MRAVNIVGYKNSGKTTLAVKLLTVLRDRGINAAALKLTHQASLDKPETDTFKLLRAAQAVAALGAGESAVFWREAKPIESLLPLLGADLVVVEGGKDLTIMPRIVVAQDAAQARELGAGPGGLALAVFGPQAVDGVPATMDVQVLADLVVSQAFLLPNLNCQACGFESCKDMAWQIVSGRASPSQCQTLSAPVEVLINGRPLAMNPFVGRILSSAVRAMLAEMKGYYPGEAVITIKA